MKLRRYTLVGRNMRAIAVLALCFAAVAAVPTNPQRIIGGSVTTIEQYPGIAALLYTFDLSTYWQNCGGSILNNRAILTAAHCPFGDALNRWRVRVGSTFGNSGGTVFNSARIIIHGSYNPWTLDNDMAIIHIAGTISFSNAARPATIAGANYNVADNQVVWAAGWGRTVEGGPLSEQLRHVQIWTINQATCRSRYAEVRLTVTDNMMCSGWLDVGGRDQCQGDSGGPLYHNNIVVGVCSWGHGCGRPRFPGVNARVSRYTAWINSNA